MANTATYVAYGYGQVEPNHLSAQRTGQIYAQLPAASTIDELQNGQFVKYDYANGVCNFTGAGEWMLVFNEVKVYEDRQTDKDYVMKKTDHAAKIYDAAGHTMPTGTTMVPRVFKTNVGDIFTTNCVIDDVSSGSSTLVEGVKLVINNSGFLTKAGESPTGMIFEIAKVTTLPDGQKALKVMRIQ